MRLIDADSIRIKPEYMYDMFGSIMIRVEDLARIINEMPSAQEIIRCKDCRHNGSFDTDCPISWPKDEDDFCSYSEG